MFNIILNIVQYMARRKDHSRAELRQLAIEKGQKLVKSKGPAALTARNIAKVIGYTPGTLYNVFENIDELAAEINCATLAMLADDISTILRKQKTPQNRLSKICAAYLKLHKEQPHLWTLLFAWPIEHQSETYSHAVHQVFDRVVEVLLPLSKSHVAARRDAKIIWSTLHGICSLQQSGKLDVEQADSTELLVKHFLNAFV